MKRYDQVFTLEVEKSMKEIISILKVRGEDVVVTGNSIVVNHNPTWYKIFSGRGIITMQLNNTGSESKSVMQCTLSPSLANVKTIAIFLLCNIPLWAALLYFFPWNVILLIVFLIEWLIMAFIAIPIFFVTLLTVTGYVLSISMKGPSIFFILITWSFFLLLVNAAMRYNRGELKRWVSRVFLQARWIAFIEVTIFFYGILAA